MIDFSKLSIHSDFNYLKRGIYHTKNIQSASLTYVYDYVQHNYGYIPMIYTGAELNNDGILWSNSIVDIYSQLFTSGADTDYITLEYWIDNNTLTLAVYDGAFPAKGYIVPVYAVIYKDYGS